MITDKVTRLSDEHVKGYIEEYGEDECGSSSVARELLELRAENAKLKKALQ